MHRITVIGPGRLGGALALALSRSGSKIDQLIYRSRGHVRALAAKFDPQPKITAINKVESIYSPILLITVQDEEIPKVVRAIAHSVDEVRAIFHTSGSLSSEVLDVLRSRQRAVASLHPLASISNWNDGQERFAGSYFCLEGDAKAIRIGRSLVSELGGLPFTINGDHKPLYHAAALTAAGHITALFDIAVEFMIKTGVDRRASRRMLQPLLAGVTLNLAKQDTVKALTGTYARADEATMKRHLEALGSSATKEEFVVYLELALRSIELAMKTGVNLTKLERMQKSIIVAKENVE